MRRPLIAAFIGLAMAASADPVPCPDTPVTIVHQNAAYTELACNAARRAYALFAQCNMPPIARSINIHIVDQPIFDAFEGKCLGLYHCDEDKIEILSPALIQQQREPDSAFADLSHDEYFASLVVHELAHAASQDIPCPFETCIVAGEYISFAMQIMSLDPGARAKFEDRSGLDEPVSSEELSTIILLMAPGLFAQKTWAHLSQRDDACHYIGALTGGRILLDRDHF